MSMVTSAVRRVLAQQEPFPAIVMDRYWNVLLTNQSTLDFFNSFIDMAARTGPRNMLHLIFDPAGMRPHVAHWDSVARSLIQRVRRESIGHVVDAQTQELLEALFAYPGVKRDWLSEGFSSADTALPMVPLGFVKDGTVLNYFSMITTVGAPLSIASQEMRIESMFPADEATEVRHLTLIGAKQQQL